jgi:hypothetical protein
MLVPAADAQKHGDRLDHFLMQLKDELITQSRDTHMGSSPKVQDLDSYLLELNSFYYTSFHRRFFPLYRKIIEEDIRSLYRIGMQEQTLKRDIISSIKQHATLFNKVKSMSAILKVKREETKQLIVASYPRNDERCVELLYILKELANDWIDFQDMLNQLQTVLEDKKLLANLNQYPAHATVANLINGWSGNVKSDRDLNKLMAGWQLAIKLLIKLQENQSPTKEATRAIKVELDKIDASWDNRKIPPALRSWYKQYIQKTFSLYMELIYLYGEKNDIKYAKQIAGQFEDWLQALLYILEQSLVYKSRGWDEMIANAFVLTRMDAEYLKELKVYFSRVLPSLEELINTLSSSSQADYQYHSQRSQQVLAEASQFFMLQIDNNVKPRGILLLAKMEKLKNKVALLENRIYLLDEKAEHSLETAVQYQLSFNMLNSYLELIQSMQAQLLKSLSTRNIKRNFQDINLHIDHIPLKVGELFPPDYLYMNDKTPFETQETDARPTQILYEEGDIFIINLDELQEELIPKVILSKKG